MISYVTAMYYQYYRIVIDSGQWLLRNSDATSLPVSCSLYRACLPRFALPRHWYLVQLISPNTLKQLYNLYWTTMSESNEQAKPPAKQDENVINEDNAPINVKVRTQRVYFLCVDSVLSQIFYQSGCELNGRWGLLQDQAEHKADQAPRGLCYQGWEGCWEHSVSHFWWFFHPPCMPHPSEIDFSQRYHLSKFLGGVRLRRWLNLFW